MKKAIRIILFFLLCLNTVYSQKSESVKTSVRIPEMQGGVNHSYAKGGPITPQDGNSSLATNYAFSACGLGYTAASVSLYMRLAGGTAQPASLSISGIPACAQIEKAFLYTDASGNGIAINATLKNPLNTTNVFPMTMIGSSIDKCWITAGYNATYSYRADVTSIISGNGVYTLSGLPTGATNDVDGATLIIIYKDPSASYTGNIVLADGANVSQGGVISHNLTGFSACSAASTATGFMIATDLQQVGDVNLVLNGTGSLLPAASQNFWNFEQLNTSVFAGQSSSYFEVNTASDCYNLLMVGLYYRTNCATCTPPTLAIATTQTTSCGTNGAASASASGGTAPYSYLWTGGFTTQTISGLSPGTYNVSVTDANNCITGSAVVTVPGNTIAATASASGPPIITCTNPNIVLNGGGGGSYSWSGPGIVSGANTANPTVNQPGNYSLIVTSGLCTSPAVVVSISQNTTLPGAAASAGGILTCAAPNITLSGSPGGMNYSWSGPGIVSGGSTTSPVVNQPGTYNLTVTDPSNGCSSNTGVSVSQNITPPGATASASGVITCAATSISLSGSSSGGGSYSWSGPGIVSGGNTANPMVNQAGNYNLTVTGSNGCTSTAAVNVTQNTTLPNATASSGSIVTCTSSAVSLAVSPAGLTYTWSASAGSSITGGTNSQTASANGPGPYTVVVFDPSNGCSASANVSPIINNTPPAATAVAGSGGVLTCTIANLTLTGAPSGGMNYSWSGPGIVSGGTTANPVINLPGTYNLTVTNPGNGCSANASTTISQNTVNPTVSIGPLSFTTTCASPTVQLTATSSTATANYSWLIPSTGSLNNSSIANPIASGTGVFTVVVTNTSNGCSSTAALSQVFADAAVPSVSLSASSLELTCSTTTIGVAATATGNNLSYNWSPSPLSGGNTANPVFNTPGNYAIVVTNTVNSCNTTANLSVTINTLSPSVSVSPTQTLTCVIATAALTATSSAASSSYSWTGPGITGPSNAATVIVNQAGTYSVVITDNANGCNSTVISGSVINDIIAPTATVLAVSSNSTISCVSPTVTLFAASTPTNVSYAWSTGVNTPSAGIVGSGVVTVTVTNMINGCKTTAPYNVTGNTILPPVATTSGTLACASTTVALLATSTNTTVTYTWSGPSPSSIISGANNASPICSEVGTYTLVITDPITLCSTTTTVSVIQGSITAAFTANPSSGVSPLSVNFTNQSVGAVAYNWNFGNGNTSSAVDPSQVFTGSLTYTVMLVASAGPCVDTAYATVVVDDDLIIEIPNVFTPNGDGANDVFSIKTTGVKDIELQIFNRWGQKLYTFAGVKAVWDGMTAQGQAVPDGTYFFFVKANGINGKTIEKQGTLNVFK